MTTCQCQKPLVNAHGCCGYCGKAANEPQRNVVSKSVDGWPISEPINEVMLPPSGAMADGLMEFVEKGQREAAGKVEITSRGEYSEGKIIFEVEKFTPKAGDLISIRGPVENHEEMLNAAIGLQKMFPGVNFLVSPNDVVVSSERQNDRLAHATARWRDCLEVIEQTYKRHPNGVGVPVPSIRGNALYVLDWRPDEPKRTDAVKVEHVVKVDGDTVEMIGSVTDLETFASLVVGGPFPLEVESDGDE